MPTVIHPAHRLIVVLICIGVAGLHFITGPAYQGPFPRFVNGYLIDLVLPFAMCLLLGIQQLSALRRPIARFVLVFGVGAASETMQYFGVPIFGRTFDPLDLVMFAVGSGAAFLFERILVSWFPAQDSS
jgi:hypothetical protein